MDCTGDMAPAPDITATDTLGVRQPEPTGAATLGVRQPAPGALPRKGVVDLAAYEACRGNTPTEACRWQAPPEGAATMVAALPGSDAEGDLAPLGGSAGRAPVAVAGGDEDPQAAANAPEAAGETEGEATPGGQTTPAAAGAPQDASRPTEAVGARTRAGAWSGVAGIGDLAGDSARRWSGGGDCRPSAL